MSTYRLNLTVDEQFSQVLEYFKAQFPLLSDIEIIKMIVGEKYAASKQKNYQNLLNSLPDLKLTEKERQELNNSLQKSLESGFQSWDKDKFIEQMEN